MFNEETHESDGQPQSSVYLTASELVSCRKASDEQSQCSVGQKLYNRSRTSFEDEALKSVVESYKGVLNQNRTSKICELMQAEWNKDLKVAFTEKLKGKFVQHMGHRIDGKLALCPEEAVFLLENGCLEIVCDKMPLSAEQAYTVILGDKQSTDKFQVYSYLSQLGFIVVAHQKKLGVTRYEKRMNLDKHQVKKKRKSTHVSPEQPHKKRLTFTGVLSDNSGVKELSDVCINEEMSTVISDDQCSNREGVSAICAANENIAVEHGEKSTSIRFQSHTEGATEHGESTSIHFQSHAQGAEKSFNDVNDCTNPSNFADNSCDITTVSNDSAIKSTSSVILKQSSNITNNEKHSEQSSKANLNPIDIDDSQSTEHSFSATEKSRRFMVENANSDNVNEIVVCNTQNDGGNSSDGIEIEENSEKNPDIMSCSMEDSSETDFDTSDSAENIVKKSLNDDEITLLEVKKKETKPLAVIDLFSDEEQDNIHMDDETVLSDDEIQVVKVCGAVSVPNPKHAPSKNVRKKKLLACKKEMMWGAQNSTQNTFRPTVQFPDLYKKKVACIPRPPLHLLPNHLRPAKEVYVFDLKKECPPQYRRRLWNSYRDIQQYQRDRRSGTLRYSGPRPLKNENQSSCDRGYRSYGPTTDYTHNHGRSNSPEMYGNNRDFPPYVRPGFYDYTRSVDPHSIAARNNETNVRRFQNPSSYNPMLGGNSFASNFSSNLPNQRPAGSTDFMSELYRTAYCAATNLLTSMLSPNLNSIGVPDYHSNPMEGNFSFQANHSNGSFVSPSPFPFISWNAAFGNADRNSNGISARELNNQIPSSATYGEEQSPYFNAEPYFTQNHRGDRGYRPRSSNRARPFPCHYRNLSYKNSWNEVKAAIGAEAEENVENNSDIVEVPININKVLWSSNIYPMVKPGLKYPVSDILKTVRVTQMAKLLDKGNKNERYLPVRCELEISFDVYLPGTNYKKTCPDIPKHRIVVVRPTELPKYSEIVLLQRKWNDGAVLQFAVVDDGNISFHSFNSIGLPIETPFEP